MRTEKQMNRDYWTVKAMHQYGGSFVKKLAEAAYHADEGNLARIKGAWTEYWGEYEGMGRSLERSAEHIYERFNDDTNNASSH